MSNIMSSVNGAKQLFITFGKLFANHSSTVCLVTALATGTATVVTACQATIEAQPIIEEAKACIADINEHAEEDEEYAANKKLADLRDVKMSLMKDMTKCYLKSVIFGTVTVGLAVCSHNKQNKTIKDLKTECASLSAGFSALKDTFDKYRANVVADAGEEKDREYLFGIRDVEEQVITKTKSGKEKVTTEIRKGLPAYDELPPLVRCISEESCGLVVDGFMFSDKDKLEKMIPQDYKGNQYLLMALKDLEGFINDYIKTNGGITVEKIDEYLRMDINLSRPEAEFNRNAGCVWDPHKPFSFNLYDIKDPDKRDFYNGYEHRIYIEIPINSVNVCRDIRELAELGSKRRRGLIA